MSKWPPSCKSNASESQKLTEEQEKELQKLTNEMSNSAFDVVEDFKENPSENSGSTIQVHEDSPYLYDWLVGDRWKKVLSYLPQELFSKKKNEDDTE